MSPVTLKCGAKRVSDSWCGARLQWLSRWDGDQSRAPCCGRGPAPQSTHARTSARRQARTNHERRVAADGVRPAFLEGVPLLVQHECRGRLWQRAEVGDEVAVLLAAVLQLRELEAAERQALEAGEAHLSEGVDE